MARVLIADNDQNSITTLTAEIEAEGHEVCTVTTGIEAYEHAISRPPDMVLLAPNLAACDGYETCARLRSDPDVPQRLPIIMIGPTGLDPRRMERCGATATLSRDAGAFELRELLGRWLSA